MTPEAQRIAIAEACGWYDVKIRDGWCYGYRTKEGDAEGEDIPDYLNDLNAMHEAEKVLLKLQQDYKEHESPNDHYGCYTRYIMILKQVPEAHRKYGAAICATAAQRAEAFLKCLGKWKDEQCSDHTKMMR